MTERKGCLKSNSPTPVPSRTQSPTESAGAGSDRPTLALGGGRKCVSFCETNCKFFVADEWDRTPTEPTRKLSYQDMLEFKEIQKSLPRAIQPADPFSRRSRQLLSSVPIGLLPLLATTDDEHDDPPTPPSPVSSPPRSMPYQPPDLIPDDSDDPPSSCHFNRQPSSPLKSPPITYTPPSSLFPHGIPIRRSTATSGASAVPVTSSSSPSPSPATTSSPTSPISPAVAPHHHLPQNHLHSHSHSHHHNTPPPHPNNPLYHIQQQRTPPAAFLPRHLSHLLPSSQTQPVRQKPKFTIVPLLDTPSSDSDSSPFSSANSSGVSSPVGAVTPAMASTGLPEASSAFTTSSASSTTHTHTHTSTLTALSNSFTTMTMTSTLTSGSVSSSSSCSDRGDPDPPTPSLTNASLDSSPRTSPSPNYSPDLMPCLQLPLLNTAVAGGDAAGAAGVGGGGVEDEGGVGVDGGKGSYFPQFAAAMLRDKAMGMSMSIEPVGSPLLTPPSPFMLDNGQPQHPPSHPGYPGHHHHQSYHQHQLSQRRGYGYGYGYFRSSCLGTELDVDAGDPGTPRVEMGEMTSRRTLKKERKERRTRKREVIVVNGMEIELDDDDDLDDDESRCGAEDDEEDEEHFGPRDSDRDVVDVPVSPLCLTPRLEAVRGAGGR